MKNNIYGTSEYTGKIYRAREYAKILKFIALFPKFRQRGYPRNDNAIARYRFEINLSPPALLTVVYEMFEFFSRYQTDFTVGKLIVNGNERTELNPEVNQQSLPFYCSALNNYSYKRPRALNVNDCDSNASISDETTY